MTGPPRESRLREALSAAGVVASYASGLGTVVLALFIFGVRPDNFAAWLVSPVGLFLIGSALAVWFWRYRKGRR